MTTFTLRPLERHGGTAALDQHAFRVHLGAKDLKTLGLGSGDVVRISTVSGPRGYAVAWLAQQTNPGSKPIVKITDILREKYELALADPVMIEKAEINCEPIDTLHVSFPGMSSLPSTYSSEEEFKYWIGDALGRASQRPRIDLLPMADTDKCG